MEYDKLAQLVEQYEPNPEVLQQLGRVQLLMVVGPSGVGKSTLMKASGMPEVLGDASRWPRRDEQNGVDYWFRSEAEMLEEIRAGKYVQVAIGAEGDLKATHAGSFPEKGQAVFAVVASAVPVFRALPFEQTKTAVIVPPDYDTWMDRLAAHHDAPDRLARRMAEARQSYSFALHDDQAQFVLNDTVELAVERMRQVVAEQPVDRAEEARTIAESLLQQLR